MQHKIYIFCSLLLGISSLLSAQITTEHLWVNEFRYDNRSFANINDQADFVELVVHNDILASPDVANYKLVLYASGGFDLDIDNPAPGKALPYSKYSILYTDAETFHSLADEDANGVNGFQRCPEAGTNYTILSKNMSRLQDIASAFALIYDAGENSEVVQLISYERAFKIKNHEDAGAAIGMSTELIVNNLGLAVSENSLTLENHSIQLQGTGAAYEDFNWSDLPDNNDSPCAVNAGQTINDLPCIPPDITNPGDQNACDSYTLESIQGRFLSGSQAYYDDTQDNGGQMISGTITETMTIYIYDAKGACSDEESFVVTISQSPSLDAISDVNECDSYDLPTTINGTNLTGNQAFYNDSQDNGGTVISGTLTTTQTVYVYDASGPCDDEISFIVNIAPSPQLDAIADENVCDLYTLPNSVSGSSLSGNQGFFTGPDGTGTPLAFGSDITTTTTVYVYDNNNGCTDEQSFTVTVTPSPSIDVPANQTHCDSYELPEITGTNLTEFKAYYDDTQANGGQPISGTLTSSQTVYIYDVNGNCSDEQNFSVTIDASPEIANPGNVTACDSYTLEAIGGNNLTGNQAYYDDTQANGGQVITGPITATQMVYIFDNNNGCTDEESFMVTITDSPDIANPGDIMACDSYILPDINGTNLTGFQSYYDNSQANGGMPISGSLTSTQTVWIYDVNGSCSDEESFLVTITNSPEITNPGAITACDSYTLPSIDGNNLTGNEAYYDDTQANGGQVIASPITSTQTVYIYDTNGSCSDEQSFLVTITDSPEITNPGDATVCDSYSLPAINGNHLTSNEAYYDNSQANGGQMISGPITSTQTVYIYDVNGSCSDEESFLVTVNLTPSIANPGNITSCGDFTLPAIMGTNLTGNERYYDMPNGMGTAFDAGQAVSASTTLYIYDATGTTPNCSDEVQFDITIDNVHDITNPGTQTACGSYTLPAITGLITGNEKYYTATMGGGTEFLPGDEITSTTTLFIYDNTGSDCSTDEESFAVTINNAPEINDLADQTACDSYVLPDITGNNLTVGAAYFTMPNGGGTSFDAGESVSSSQTLYIYDNNGDCNDEQSFELTIIASPDITNPGPQSDCDVYVLPDISGSNLNNAKYYNNSQANGGIEITGAVASDATIWIFASNGTCTDEESFELTITNTPSISQPNDVTTCDSYTLPVINGVDLNNARYFDNSQATSGTEISGPITTSMTVWIYDEINGCSDEKSFQVNIIDSPDITAPNAASACDSYTLPMINGNNLNNPQYYDNSQAAGGQAISGPITSTQTVWIYDAAGSCSDEESFMVTITNTPDIAPPTNVTACDSYTLPMINGTNLSNAKYYNDSQANNGSEISGDITSSMTVWIYDENNDCSDEESFEVSIIASPVLADPGTIEDCDSYTLPAIQGDNLNNPQYYNNSQANGGQPISGTLTSSQLVYVYDAAGNCSDELSFQVNITPSPSITSPGNKVDCDSYTLPSIEGDNLVNAKYYNNSQAMGGTEISGTITSTQTVWIYDTNGACSDEKSFQVTITDTPEINAPANQTACDSYTLPTIQGNNLNNPQYYDNSQTNNGQLISGSITSTQTVWIYDANGPCSDEESFIVTIDATPNITQPSDVTVCESYLLPNNIAGSNLNNPLYYTDSQANGGQNISGNILTTQRIYIYDERGNCSDEKSFMVFVNDFNPGSAGMDQTIESGEDVAPFTVNVAASGPGTFTYQWQSRKENETFSDIDGATEASYDEGTLEQTTYYRRLTTSTLNSRDCLHNGEELKITVNQPPLSVEWLYLKARPVNQQSLLEWATSSEINTTGYYIQWSVDGTIWQGLGFVEAQHKASDYEFLHQQPVKGINYYRLLEFSDDKRGDYSDVVSVVIEGKTASVKSLPIAISPNPTIGEISITLPEVYDLKEKTLINIFDINGQLVTQRVLQDTNLLDLSHLSAGIYQIEAVQNDLHSVGQVVKME